MKLTKHVKQNLTDDQVTYLMAGERKAKELSPGKGAYFVVFLPRESSWRGTETDAWHLEIGGSYSTNKNGGIWSTAPGLIGKERQIEQVIRLHNQGE